MATSHGMPEFPEARPVDRAKLAHVPLTIQAADNPPMLRNESPGWPWFGRANFDPIGTTPRSSPRRRPGPVPSPDSRHLSRTPRRPDRQFVPTIMNSRRRSAREWLSWFVGPTSNRSARRPNRLPGEGRGPVPSPDSPALLRRNPRPTGSAIRADRNILLGHGRFASESKTQSNSDWRPAPGLRRGDDRGVLPRGSRPVVSMHSNAEQSHPPSRPQSQLFVEISPIRIQLFDQRQLPLPPPLLEILLPLNRRNHCWMHLIPGELIYAMRRCKAGDNMVLCSHTAPEVGGNSDIQSSVATGGQNVDGGLHSFCYSKT